MDAFPSLLIFYSFLYSNIKILQLPSILPNPSSPDSQIVGGPSLMTSRALPNLHKDDLFIYLSSFSR